jgi:hypothetical protein
MYNHFLPFVIDKPMYTIPARLSCHRFKRCNVNISPTDVSSNVFPRTMRPLEEVSLKQCVTLRILQGIWGSRLEQLIFHFCIPDLSAAPPPPPTFVQGTHCPRDASSKEKRRGHFGQGHIVNVLKTAGCRRNWLHSHIHCHLAQQWWLSPFPFS